MNVFARLHVWTANTQTAQERAAWRAAAALTQDYLARFETELPKAAHAAELIAAMQQADPDAGLAIALDIGAKVSKGEMKW